MDVKVGSGALMPTFDQSMQLAQALGVEMLLYGIRLRRGGRKAAGVTG